MTNRQPELSRQQLRHMDEIIGRVQPQLGSMSIAFAWYCSEPLGRFCGQTAQQLVANGRAHEVVRYIETAETSACA